jgi:dsDNA-specific endonuclease/ATPase MutS2
METKLTLKLKRTTIERGKRFAKKRKTSLSKLVANYIEKITEVDEEEQISPLVKSLVGVVKKDKKDWKEHRHDYTDHLIKKYK